MPKVYLTTRDREIARMKRLVAFNFINSRKMAHTTQEQAAEKYGASAPTIRKLERGINVGVPYDGFLNLLLDSGLTIVEAEK